MAQDQQDTDHHEYDMRPLQSHLTSRISLTSENIESIMPGIERVLGSQADLSRALCAAFDACVLTHPPGLGDSGCSPPERLQNDITKTLLTSVLRYHGTICDNFLIPPAISPDGTHGTTPGTRTFFSQAARPGSVPFGSTDFESGQGLTAAAAVYVKFSTNFVAFSAVVTESSTKFSDYVRRTSVKALCYGMWSAQPCPSLKVMAWMSIPGSLFHPPSITDGAWRSEDLNSKVIAEYLKFIARTVMVQEGNIEGAYRTLNTILTMDGLLEDLKRQWYCDGSTMKSLFLSNSSYEILYEDLIFLLLQLLRRYIFCSSQKHPADSVFINITNSTIGNISCSVMDNQIQAFNNEFIHLPWVPAIYYVTGTVMCIGNSMVKVQGQK
ncbi:hypothetical protein GH733_012925, partial [Mirounga leonina]